MKLSTPNFPISSSRSMATPEGTERVRASGRDATLVVWSPD
jgi:hypothetical protein